MLLRRNIITLCLWAGLLLPLSHLSAQGFLRQSELGVMVGGMNYVGDLNHQHLNGAVHPAAGLFGRYRMGERWAATASVAYGRVVGGDPDIDRLRNLSFRSHILEAAVRVEFSFVPFGGDGYSFRTSPFIFVGVGFFHFNPRALYRNPATDGEEWVDLQPLHTEGQGSEAYTNRIPYSLMQMTVPFGLGFKIALSKDVTLAFEYGYRYTWTDYLDDVSTTYVGSEVLGDGLSAAMADRSGEVEPGYVNAVGIQRGDDSLNDAYAFFNVSLTVSMETLFGWLRSKKCEIK